MNAMKIIVLNYLTRRQLKTVQKELKEEGYCVLQRYVKDKHSTDFRVLKDTVIITPTSIIDRIRWIFKRK